jgi:hypothetical protein
MTRSFVPCWWYLPAQKGQFVVTQFTGIRVAFKTTKRYGAGVVS